MDYITIVEVAKLWGISRRRISVLCTQGRIPGAAKLGYIWAIPKDAKKPADERIVSGKYVKSTK